MNAAFSLLEIFRYWLAFGLWQSTAMLGTVLVLSFLFFRSPWQRHLALTFGISASALTPAISYLILRTGGGFLPEVSIVSNDNISGPAWILGPVILAGSMFFAASILYQIISARRLMFQARPFPDRDLQEALLEGAKTMRNISLPILFTSRAVKSPSVWSWGLHPAVLLPESLGNALSPQERDAIFLHELAHLTRRDHWASLLSRLCGILLFWNPLYWIALRQVDLAADQACDLLVLSQEKVSVETYGETLLRLAAEEDGRPVFQYLSRKEQLMKRIETMLDFTENRRTISVTRTPLAVLAMAGVVLFLATALAFCQEKRSTNDKPPLESPKKTDTENMKNTEPFQSPGGYTHVVVFGPKGDFQPKTPKELLDALNEQLFKTKIKTGYYRAKPVDGKLRGAICTFDPVGLKQVVESSSRLEYKETIRLTKESFERYEKTKQTSLKSDVRSLVPLLGLDKVESYRVDKRIADFPDRIDLTTPENAYASNKCLIIGNREDKVEQLEKTHYSSAKLREREREAIEKPIDENWAKRYKNEFVVFEVVQIDDNQSFVFGLREFDNLYDGNYFRKKDDGLWYNMGNAQSFDPADMAARLRSAIDAKNYENCKSIGKFLKVKTEKTYRVDKAIADFSDKFDLSSPEEAFSTQKQLIVSNRKDKISQIYRTNYFAEKIRDRELSELTTPVSDELAKMFKSEFVIYEVYYFQDDLAFVFAKRNFDNLYDGNFFRQKEDGLWYNTGNFQNFNPEKLAGEVETALKNNLDGPAPVIVSMEPKNGAKDVDPAAVNELRVTFDRDMNTDGYSWCGGGETYPETKGMPKWIDKRTCILPVKLVPGKTYWLSINAERFQNFRSIEGVPVEPVPYSFSTVKTASSVSSD